MGDGALSTNLEALGSIAGIGIWGFPVSETIVSGMGKVSIETDCQMAIGDS